jgi:hypothetical protein
MRFIRSYQPAILLLLCAFSARSTASAQVLITTLGTPYTQNFNSVPTSATNGNTIAFTGNVSLLGWYSSETVIRTQLSSAVRNNTGDFYSVVDGTDKSIGSRPSSGTGTIDYGVRLRNNTGTTVTSVEITYTGEQWSIADNAGNANFLSVGYRIGTGITSSTTGTWTNIGALQFNQLYGNAQSAALGGTACNGTSTQCLALNGNQASNRQQLTTCLSVSIPAGQEIFIRWADVDNSANDHHLQIDDFSVTFYDVSCSVVLPVTWVGVTAEVNDKMNASVGWSVASERNNDYFEVLMSSDESPVFEPVGKVPGEGNTEKLRSYIFDKQLAQAGNYYFRIRQTDRDGKQSYSEVRSLHVSAEELYVSCVAGTSRVLFSHELAEGTVLTLTDVTGRTAEKIVLDNAVSHIDLGDKGSFTGYLTVEEKTGAKSFLVSF